MSRMHSVRSVIWITAAFCRRAMIQPMTWILPKSVVDKAECEVCNKPTEIVLEDLQGITMFLCLPLSEHGCMLVRAAHPTGLRGGKRQFWLATVAMDELVTLNFARKRNQDCSKKMTLPSLRNRCFRQNDSLGNQIPWPGNW
jgi:hypothetical protein